MPMLFFVFFNTNEKMWLKKKAFLMYMCLCAIYYHKYISCILNILVSFDHFSVLMSVPTHFRLLL